MIWPMIGMGGDKVLPTAAAVEVESAQGKELTKRRWEIFQRDYLPGLEPTPGARALVSRIKADGLKTIVATSASGNELVMLGDTPYDVQAAIGAHVGIVGVLCGGWTKEELSGATAIYDDPADLLRWYDASPFVIEALTE